MAGVSEYTEEIGQRICELIAASEKGLDKLISENDWMPASSTIYKWLDANTSFAESYTRARARQADTIFDQIIEIADDSSQDTLITDKGEVFNAEFAARSRIKIDARKWVASKLAPKKYGDKLDVTTDGDKINTTLAANITLSNGTSLTVD